MLKTTLLHPDILRVVGRAGHHASILIADGNYPASTKRGPNAELVSLNLTPGIVTVTQVLRAILSAVPNQVDTLHHLSRFELHFSKRRVAFHSGALVEKALAKFQPLSECGPIVRIDVYDLICELGSLGGYGCEEQGCRERESHHQANANRHRLTRTWYLWVLVRLAQVM